MPPYRLGIVSDIHYAGPLEQARGDDYEYRDLPNPLLRLFLRFHRQYIWLRDPLRQNHLLDQFLSFAPQCDCVVANGDYTCDTLCVGVSDDGALESVSECLGKLYNCGARNVKIALGDHEFGKFSFLGGRGGLRMESWRRVRETLRLEPFWQVEVGRYVLMGVTSTLLALPVYETETVANERSAWRQLRAEHLDQVRQGFTALKPEARVILFCHDPTALPFLWHDRVINPRLRAVEHTVIGHLHSRVILWQSRMLAGMPVLRFMGNTARRLSSALREAKYWRPFNVVLCPSLSGLELFKDGGFLSIDLEPEGQKPALVRRHRVTRLPIAA